MLVNAGSGSQWKKATHPTNRTVNWCIGGSWFTIVVGWNDPFFRTEQQQKLSNYEPQMYPLSSTSPRGPLDPDKSLCNQNEKWGRDMVRICDVLTMSVSTSFFIIKPHPWIMRRRKPLPLPAFPSLLSVHHDPLPWNYYSIDQLSTFQTHCWVLAHTYWVLFSSLLFLSSAFHECCWHIFCPWHDSHTYCMLQFDRETLLTKNKGQSATMWCLCCSLVPFWNQKTKETLCSKESRKWTIGLGQSGYIHIAHARICPSICSPDTKWSKFCQLIQNQRTNEAMPRQNVVTRHFYEI